MVTPRVANIYGSLALFQSILHNVFLLYHVETFVSVYKIDRTSFWIAEAIFLLWNSVNDPLFGWLSDYHYLDEKSRTTSVTSIIIKRLQALQRNGPLFGVCFMFLWFDWGAPRWLQMSLCLCLYDSFLTMVDLHHQALLADLSISAASRTRLNAYSSVYNALGASSVFISHLFWGRPGHSFQMFCLVLTIFSIVGYLVSTHILLDHYQSHEGHRLSHNVREVNTAANGLKEQASILYKYLKEVRNHKNFLWFTAMNLIQVFHCHFNSNFFPLFVDNLLGVYTSPAFTSFLLGISFLAPHINNIYFLYLCRKVGVYQVVRALFFLKFLLALVMFSLGPQHTWILAVFIASNRIFTEGTCKLLNLVVSDLVDEDCVLHNRKQAVSALMFGTAALFSKPGQTLAPLIGTLLLNLHTGYDVFESGSIKSNGDDESNAISHYPQQEGCFHLLVSMPIISALLQLILWTNFTLRGERLRNVKRLRATGSSHESV